MSSAPFYRLPDEERIAALSPLVGRLVELDVRPLRGVETQPSYVSGRLVAVARIYGGGSLASVAVVRPIGVDDTVAVSLAQIAGVTDAI